MSTRAVYPPAAFGRLVRLEGHQFRTWWRKFACPNPSCEQGRREADKRGRRTIGRQTIRESLDPQDWSRISGYRVERVDLGRELIPLPDLADGTLSFGLPQSVRRRPPNPGQPVPSPLHRAIPVLASVGALDQVGRHARNRVRGGPGRYWSLALSETNASQPFVVTCPDCRERCLVDGSLPEDELRRLTSIALDALRNRR